MQTLYNLKYEESARPSKVKRLLHESNSSTRIVTMIATELKAIAPASEPLTEAARQTIADVLTWDTQEYVSPEDVETIAISHDMVWVKLTNNRAVPLHVDTFRNIRRQQLEQQDVVELETTEEVNGVEVDAVGSIYRVWKGMTIIGTFYQSLVSDFWIAFTKGGDDFLKFSSADEATSAIAPSWNHLEAA